MRSFLTPFRLAVLATCALLWAVPPARADSLLFDYVGFDYEFPNPDPATFGEPGSGYVGLGTVPSLFPPIVANTTLNEYTMVIQGLTPASTTPAGTFNIINYTAGTLTIYEDSKATGTHADFTPNPPSATVPATFADGTPILVGALTGFQFIIDTVNGNGSFEADLEITGGSQILNFPLNQRMGWTFSGSTSNALNIPPGYAHQLDGQAFLNAPTAARRVTWGRLKAGYR